MLPINAFLNQNMAFVSCPRKEIVGYVVFEGYASIAKVRPRHLRNIDQQICNAYCTMNIDADGNYYPCISINYISNKEECHLYGTDSKTSDGIAYLIKNETNIFFDKICLPVANQFEHLCKEQTLFKIYPNRKITKGIIDRIGTTVSLRQCITICINNFICRSITYNNGLCMLHNVSIVNDPKAMIYVDHDYNHDYDYDTYVVENGCTTMAPSTDARTESTWDEWSNCRFGVGGKRVRVRSRNCSKADCADLQVQNCS